MPRVETRVVAIYRGDSPVPPEGTTVIQPGDEIFLIAATGNIRRVLQELRRMDRPVKRVMIGGGGNIGRRLAQAIEDKYEVKIIEYSKAGAERLAAVRLITKTPRSANRGARCVVRRVVELRGFEPLTF